MSTDTVQPVREVDLAVTGMTCASCVARVERKLSKLPGVTATVNLPLESAHVVLTLDLGDDALLAAVEAAGYGASVTGSYTPGGIAGSVAAPAAGAVGAGGLSAGAAGAGAAGAGAAGVGLAGAEGLGAGATGAGAVPLDRSGAAAGIEQTSPARSAPAPAGDRSVADSAAEHAAEHATDVQPAPERSDEHGRDLQRRLIVAAVLAVPVVAVSMVMPWHFTGWEWLMGVLTLPVATWAAWPFHRAAVKAARHGSSTMDTLVSLGVIAAMVWSIVELLRGNGHVYFEVAAVVTTFLLAGRFLEHRARRRAGNALRALLALGAKNAERVVGAASATHEGTPSVIDRVMLPADFVTEFVPVEALRAGDLFAVRPGATVATDGVVVHGASAVDTSLVTGEPVPVDVTVGDAVVGGTVNTAGFLIVRATRVGAETMLARIGRLVTQAQTGKAPVARLADRISAVFVPVVLGISVLTLAAWLLATGDVEHAFTAAVAVLIIACPCALGLATPTAILVGTGRGAQLGVLIKGPEILERTRTIDTVVLDKTGTVTQGRMVLEHVTPGSRIDETEALRYAAAVEALSEHPIAQAVAAAGALVEAARRPGAVGEDGLAEGSLQVSDFVSTPGGGVEGVVRVAHSGLSPALATGAADRPLAGGSAVPGGAPAFGAGAAPEAATVGLGAGAVGLAAGAADRLSAGGAPALGAGEPGAVSGTMRDGLLNSRRVLVGRAAWLTSRGVTVPGEIDQAVARAEDSGATTVVVAWSGAARAVLELRDPAKPTSAEAVAQLRALGLRPVLLTGDGSGAAHAAAAAVGIGSDDVFARVLPEDKVAVVSRLRDEGHVVAMVGDGINDAAALATADLGLSMGTGTDVAIEAGDITLVRGDLRAAATAVRLSRKTLRVIKENLVWAFAYNIAALPPAAAGLLNPMIAGAAMAASSVLVVSNSLRLRRVT